MAGLPHGVRLNDHVTLRVLTTTVPAALIDAALADTERQSERQRSLPARLVVYYVMALALYGQASYGAFHPGWLAPQLPPQAPKGRCPDLKQRGLEPALRSRFHAGLESC